MVHSLRTFLLGSALLSAACLNARVEQDPPAAATTAGLATRDLRPFFSAQADEGSLRIYARFASQGQTFLRLGDGDRAFATVDGAEVALAERVDGSEVRYVATLPAPGKDVIVKVGLARRDPAASALGSSVIVPAPFRLKGEPSTITTGARVSVGVEGLDGTPSAQVDGVCVKHAPARLSAALRRDGAGTTLDLSGPIELEPNTSGCEVTVAVRIETRGRLDSAMQTEQSSILDAPSFEGLVQRTFHATLARAR